MQIERNCGKCVNHKPHPLRKTEDRICGVLLKDCASITVLPASHECDFGGFVAKPN